ncbi:hypothetical protein ETAA8_53280 [Anatilimnocola aggregata]|uniref:Uncharacterized protein n=1 Tax=Anatilimnocola aggregata TaxID=2528021 RepID=A0A517YJ09_9BACT|nr:hypothetical protein [Anatilimnocola aggregata]QDU30209.1 hypothetical protein ETAA8_53280 [Anatilimnocola aggregata]
MIIWGQYEREKPEDSGRFTCPRCGPHQTFTLVRTRNYSHIYFIPIGSRVIGERVECDSCRTAFSVAVLGGDTLAVPSAFEAGLDHSTSLSGTYGNVVELLPAAVEEIKARHAKSGFSHDVVVRVDPVRSSARLVTVTFDEAVADGQDWIGQSCGIPIIVDRRVAPELQGSKIAYQDGQFVRT